MSDAAASPFTPRTVIVLILVGALAALGFLLLSGFGNDLTRNFGKEPGPASTTATGFKGLFELVQKSGGIATLVRETEDYQTADLLVLTPTAGTDPADIRTILDARTIYNDEDEPVQRPTLIVLPKWQTVRDPLRPARERRVTTEPPFRLAKLVPQVEAAKIEAGEAKRGSLRKGMGLRPFHAPQELQTIQGKNIERLIIANDGSAVLARVRDSQTFILADPDLIANHGLRRPEDALAALALLAALDSNAPGVVSFDVTLHYRPGERNLIKLMFVPPFLAVTIALVAAAILAGIATAMRFGPARREPRALALGKAALIDNIAALTRLAGKTASGGAGYADAIRDWTARRLRAPRELSGEALDAWLETRRAGFVALDRKAREAQTEAEMLRAARELDEWRKEVTA